LAPGLTSQETAMMVARDWMGLKTPPEPDWQERALELEAENAQLHAELATTRELLDMATVLASHSWQAYDAAEQRLMQLEMPPPKGDQGRPPIAVEALVFRKLLSRISRVAHPTRRAVSQAIKETAAELGYKGPERVQQIVRAAMKESGLKWR
jgi:hypothetical protein